MKNDERISASLAENVLTLLCFDDKNCRLIRAACTPQLFESAVFREIAGHAIDFIDQFGVAIKEHLPDHLDHILRGDDARKARAYSTIVTALFENKDSVNPDYVIESLHRFIRGQYLKSGVIEAVEALEAGDVVKAELAVANALKQQVVSFEIGTNITDVSTLSGVVNDLEEPGFELGIPETDRRGIIPRKKELFLLIAPRGRGKSRFAGHVAKQASIQRWSVCIITLEMGEKAYTARMIQSWFAMSRREAQVKLPALVFGRNGELIDITSEVVERPTLRDEDAAEQIMKKARALLERRKPLIIKSFPTGSLTMEMLEAYAEGLERHHNIVPDCWVIDYPDLMKHNPANKRLELGQILEALRGFGVKRNAAVVALSQGNRESETATTVTSDMVAEDISKVATADVVVTLSQTRAEKRLGLVRYGVEKARNEADKFSVLIAQAPEIEQFVIDSCMLREDYWDLDVSSDDHRDDRDDRDDPPKKRGGRQKRDD